MGANPPYTIIFVKKVVEKYIPALPQKNKEQIKRAINERLTVDPLSFGKPLSHNLAGQRRLRVGDYRVVYRVEGKNVIVTVIKHRKDVYDE